MKFQVSTIEEEVENYDIKFGIKIEQYKQKLEKIVEFSIEDQLEDKLKKYQAVLVKFEKFFNSEDFKTTLDKKVDFDFMLENNELMAKVTDFQTLKENVEHNEEKLKHLSVFASELANVILPQKLNSTYFGNQ